VLLNPSKSSFYAVCEQANRLSESYGPIDTVVTKKLADKIEITVQDNGLGISHSLYNKIFQPFFTTKSTD